jgi:hypothetical protein
VIHLFLLLSIRANSKYINKVQNIFLLDEDLRKSLRISHVVERASGVLSHALHVGPVDAGAMHAGHNRGDRHLVSSSA